jgi:cold shock protein
MEGKVKFFNSNKGFGFVICDDGKEYFVHHSGLLDNVVKDEVVIFDLEKGDKGPKCINVKRKKTELIKEEKNGK